MNIALEKTEEFVNGKLRRNYGDAFVRGNNGSFGSISVADTYMTDIRLSSLHLCQLKDHWHHRVWSWYTLLTPKLRSGHGELNFVYLSRIRTSTFHPILNLLELDLAFPSSCHASCHLILLDLGLLLRRIYHNTTMNMSRAVQKWSSCLSRPQTDVLLSDIVLIKTECCCIG